MPLRFVISSGHGLYVRGASGCMDEVDEARRVVDQLAAYLTTRGAEVRTYHDNVSKSQSENLNRITDFHNAQGPHDLDVSVHFNAFDTKAHGTEVLYLSQQELAADVSAAIASVGFTNRGAKKRTDLHFLNKTAEASLLLEICFCDNAGDTSVFRASFNKICDQIATVLTGIDSGEEPEEPEEIELTEPDPGYLFAAVGKCSHFGGPQDSGVSASEGLAFHYELTEKNQHLFLPLQPKGTTGLARRLNAKAVHYVACRWDYAQTPKEMLAGDQMALVTSTRTDTSVLAFPADWGPHGDTKRVADLSPAIMRDLDLDTDDEVEVVYPYSPED